MWLAKGCTVWLLCCCVLLCAVRSGVAGEFDLVRDVEYAKRDESPLKADVYVPHGPGPFPGVLVVHGGAWMAGSKLTMRRPAELLAEHGYTAVNINYRLAPGAPFPAQIEDCKSAVRWMRRNAEKFKMDSSRVGGLGYSAGGHLVALLGTTDPSAGLEGADVGTDAPSTRLQAVVAGGAPCDFRVLREDSPRLSYWLGGTRAEKPKAYELASPATFCSPDDPPMLFYHGELDSLVPIDSPRAMVVKLTEVGVSARLLTVPKAGHRAARFDETPLLEGIKFLDEKLKTADK